MTAAVFVFGTLALAWWFARRFLRDLPTPPPSPVGCQHPRSERCRSCHEVVR